VAKEFSCHGIIGNRNKNVFKNALKKQLETIEFSTTDEEYYSVFLEKNLLFLKKILKPFSFAFLALLINWHLF